LNIKKSQKSEVMSEKGNGETGKRGNKRKKSPAHRFSDSPIHSRLIFILGGARSGKSVYALKLAESIVGKRLYLATAEALDDEMAERIKKHKRGRGNNWTTIEKPVKIADVIAKDKKHDVILLDCITIWLSNLITNSASKIENQKSKIENYINSLVSACKKTKANIIVVSNEVGLGIVPDNPLARQFRDISGYANQRIAEAADEVYFVVSGIGVKVK